MMKQRPGRAAFLRALHDIQALVSQALSVHMNDRDPERASKVQVAQEKAFDLCVEAQASDPPAEP